MCPYFATKCVLSAVAVRPGCGGSVSVRSPTAAQLLPIILVTRGLRTIAACAAGCFLSAPAGAQPAAAGPEEDASAWTRLAQRLLTDQDETGVPAFTIVFGGIKPGSGLALGPAVGLNFSRGGYLQAAAEYSLHEFKLLQVRYQSPAWLDHKLVLSSRVRWQDAPEISLFPLGADSPMRFATYGEERSEFSATATIRPIPRWTFTAGTAYERYQTTGGRLGHEPESLTTIPDVPGLAARTAFVHSSGSASYDTRPSPEYATRGWMIGGALHHYADTVTGVFTFSGAQAFGDLLLPGVSRKGVFDVLGHAWTTHPAGGSVVPVFLMPYLGSGDDLRGYRLYRFRSRDALLFTVEHRYAVREFLDVVGFADTGTVSRTVGAIPGTPFRSAYGAGVLLHSPKSTICRLDVARSPEGFQWAVSFSSALPGSS